MPVRASRERHPFTSATVLPVALVVILLTWPTGIVAAGPGAQPQKDQQTAEQHLENGRAAIKAREYSRAKNELNQARSMKKEMPEPYLLLGWLARRDGKLKDAFGYFDQALKYRPQYVEAHYWLGRAYLDARDGKRCKQELDAIHRLDPSFGLAYVLQGDLLITRSGMFQAKEALAAYEEALRHVQSDDESLASLKDKVEVLRTYVEFESHTADGRNKRPRALNAPRPNYTETARQAHIQGRVTIALLVNEMGRAGPAIVLSSLGYGLDEEALKVARQVRFSPATRDGVPVSTWQPIEVEFNLR
jgi:TonB family protein